MRELHIESDGQKDFLENLRELMVYRGISKLNVDAREISKMFFGETEIFDSKNVVIQKFVEFENIHGFYLVGEKQKLFLIFEENFEAAIETGDVFRYVDLAKILKLYRNGKEVLSFLEI